MGFAKKSRKNAIYYHRQIKQQNSLFAYSISLPATPYSLVHQEGEFFRGFVTGEGYDNKQRSAVGEDKHYPTKQKRRIAIHRLNIINAPQRLEKSLGSINM